MKPSEVLKSGIFHIIDDFIMSTYVSFLQSKYSIFTLSPQKGLQLAKKSSSNCMHYTFVISIYGTLLPSKKSKWQSTFPLLSPIHVPISFQIHREYYHTQHILGTGSLELYVYRLYLARPKVEPDAVCTHTTRVIRYPIYAKYGIIFHLFYTSN